ncbi:MAG: helix-turn-helix domain-containing protein [Atopobiaceae bacterium]|nr:helix-turn-helix domain-containing protein [Atopobiaceae bacterium]
MAIPTTESVRLYKDRADAATRLLERRRESLEVAIAALEIVGYKVYQDREGSYRVEPPHDRISKYEAVPEVKPTPQVKARLLEDYPTMLTVKDVSEIMGFSEGAVRRLCKEDKIPNMKMGGRIRIPKQYILEPFETDRGPEGK